VTRASLGRLVAFFNWSSDSLAHKTLPPAAHFELGSIAVRYDSEGYASVVDTSGIVSRNSRVPTITLQVPDGSYQFQVDALGAVSLDTTLTIRKGFTDTAYVFLQASGIQMCGISGMAPNQRMKLSRRGGHGCRKMSVLSVAAAARSLCAIR
jgi:hypothetical protein